MMIPTMLLLLAAGIGLTQAVSDPRAVTLPWLRLGGLIAFTLLAVATVAIFYGEDAANRDAIMGVVLPILMFTVQLMAVQLGRRGPQRIAAGAGFIVATFSATIFAGYILLRHKASLAEGAEITPGDWAALAVTVALSGGLLGGFLMTMLLGHAYLTAGNAMTQSPFRRVVLMLAVLLLARAIASLALGLLPWLNSPPTSGSQLWLIMMIVARYAVGIVVTAAFLFMTHACVKHRANQSATGILYVAGVLIIIGEWSALSLLDSTGFAF